MPRNIQPSTQVGPPDKSDDDKSDGKSEDGRSAILPPATPTGDSKKALDLVQKINFHNEQIKEIVHALDTQFHRESLQSTARKNDLDTVSQCCNYLSSILENNKSQDGAEEIQTALSALQKYIGIKTSHHSPQGKKQSPADRDQGKHQLPTGREVSALPCTSSTKKKPAQKTAQNMPPLLSTQKQKTSGDNFVPNGKKKAKTAVSNKKPSHCKGKDPISDVPESTQEEQQASGASTAEGQLPVKDATKSSLVELVSTPASKKKNQHQAGKKPAAKDEETHSRKSKPSKALKNQTLSDTPKSRALAGSDSVGRDSKKKNKSKAQGKPVSKNAYNSDARSSSKPSKQTKPNVSNQREASSASKFISELQETVKEGSVQSKPLPKEAASSCDEMALPLGEIATSEKSMPGAEVTHSVSQKEEQNVFADANVSQKQAIRKDQENLGAKGEAASNRSMQQVPAATDSTNSLVLRKRKASFDTNDRSSPKRATHQHAGRVRALASESKPSPEKGARVFETYDTWEVTEPSNNIKEVKNGVRLSILLDCESKGDLNYAHYEIATVSELVQMKRTRMCCLTYDGGKEQDFELNPNDFAIMDKEDVHNDNCKHLAAGQNVKVWWTADNEFYPATLTKVNESDSFHPHYLVYHDDGYREWTNLKNRHFGFIDEEGE